MPVTWAVKVTLSAQTKGFRLETTVVVVRHLPSSGTTAQNGVFRMPPMAMLRM